MRFIRVAATGELSTNSMITIFLSGKEILLANIEGSYFAISNTCTHAGGSLGKGILKGGIVTCPNHGARFDMKTGEAVGETRIGIKMVRTANEECYPVKVEGTDILIGIP